MVSLVFYSTSLYIVALVYCGSGLLWFWCTLWYMVYMVVQVCCGTVLWQYHMVCCGTGLLQQPLLWYWSCVTGLLQYYLVCCGTGLLWYGSVVVLVCCGIGLLWCQSAVVLLLQYCLVCCGTGLVVLVCCDSVPLWHLRIMRLCILVCVLLTAFVLLMHDIDVLNFLLAAKDGGLYASFPNLMFVAINHMFSKSCFLLRLLCAFVVIITVIENLYSTTSRQTHHRPVLMLGY